MIKNISCTDCKEKINIEAAKDYLITDGAIQEFDAEGYLEIEQHCEICTSCTAYRNLKGI